MKNKLFVTIIPLIAIPLIVGLSTMGNVEEKPKTETVAVTTINSEIAADGSIHSQNEATLHFQIAGKVTYLPFKEGDAVTSGQTIASLDSYTLQKQLTSAVNNLKTLQDTYSLTQQRNAAGVLDGQQRLALDQSNKNGYTAVPQTDVIYQTVQAILNQNKTNLDNAQIGVDIAQYAFQLTTLTSPIDGILVHEDITTPLVNVTPQTSFVVADPNALVFRANVLAQDIDFVSEGNVAKIHIDGIQDKSFTGTVVRIYPQKVSLPTGQDVYQVDIQSDDLKNSVQLGQGGNAVIQNNNNQKVILVPTWTILSHNYIWVEEYNRAVLKKVTVEKTHGDKTEILDGLSPQDAIIIDPQSVAEKKYSIL